MMNSSDHEIFKGLKGAVYPNCKEDEVEGGRRE
jgi:hypothetical protein